MNDKLQEIKTDLAVNGKQTKEKRLVMAEFSKETTYHFTATVSSLGENALETLETHITVITIAFINFFGIKI
jgi:hemerythrin